MVSQSPSTLSTKSSLTQPRSTASTSLTRGACLPRAPPTRRSWSSVLWVSAWKARAHRLGKHLQTLTGSSQSVMYTEFSPSNELLLGSSNDNSVKLWNIKTARLKVKVVATSTDGQDTLTGHIGKIYSAKFTADASKIVSPFWNDSPSKLSGSHDRTLKIWDLHRAMCIRTVFTFSSCNDVCIIDADA